MRTINLQTVYQLVITALLLGACLGLLGQRLPTLLEGASLSFEQPIVAAEASTIAAHPQASVQHLTTSKRNDANVQVEVEVHTLGNASAQASAQGPGNTEVRASTEGEGDGRSVAYLKAPDTAGWSSSAPSTVETPAMQEPSTQQSSIVRGEPQAQVSEEVANLRSSPTLAGPVVGTASRGEVFTIIGRDQTSTWWLVCCDQAQSLWIYSGVVQITGNFSRIGVVHQPNTVANVTDIQEVNMPTPTPAPAIPTPLPPVSYEFMLAEQVQFEEHVVPRIFFYVHQQEAGLGGYTARVRKDGIELPVDRRTVAGVPGYTWPIPNERQRYTNLKVEFPQVPVAGLWEVQLLDATGRAVGPIAIFRLQPNDTQREMYVRYHQ